MSFKPLFVFFDTLCGHKRALSTIMWLYFDMFCHEYSLLCHNFIGECVSNCQRAHFLFLIDPKLWFWVFISSFRSCATLSVFSAQSISSWMEIGLSSEVICGVWHRSVLYFLFIFKKKSADLYAVFTDTEPGEAFGCDTLRSYFFPLQLPCLPGWAEC